MPFGCSISSSSYGTDCFPLSPLLCNSGCESGLEEGRIRAVILVKEAYVDFLCADPTDPTRWLTILCNNAGVAAIETSGTFDGGSEVTSSGYGARQNITTGITYSLNYLHPLNIDNIPIYNSLKNRNDLHVFFLTKNYLFDGGAGASIFMQTPIESDITSIVNHSITVTWSTLVYPHAIRKPGTLFDTCSEYTAIIDCFVCVPLPPITNFC